MNKINIKIKNITIIVICLILSMLFLGGINNNNVKAEEKTKKIILIDPGHGGIDGGAVSKRGTVEKNINLDISIKLKDKLEKQGYTVFLTRSEDKGLYSDKGRIRDKKIEDLNNRCNMKEDSNCDLFLSIHLNMFPQDKYYGAQVWYSRDEESKKIAKLLQNNLRIDLDNSNKRVEKPSLDEYKILRCSRNIPSVIVECGFLSNIDEENKLKTDAYQDKIAESITRSIIEYYKHQMES